MILGYWESHHSPVYLFWSKSVDQFIRFWLHTEKNQKKPQSITTARLQSSHLSMVKKPWGGNSKVRCKFLREKQLCSTEHQLLTSVILCSWNQAKTVSHREDEIPTGLEVKVRSHSHHKKPFQSTFGTKTTSSKGLGVIVRFLVGTPQFMSFTCSPLDQSFSVTKTTSHFLSVHFQQRGNRQPFLVLKIDLNGPVQWLKTFNHADPATPLIALYSLMIPLC